MIWPLIAHNSHGPLP